ncbi:MAG: hypothetical protein WDN28_03575 [Chthoniobacter sp.]
MNAYVVKPVDFTDFLAAIKQLGIFWAVVNEPPFAGTREDSGLSGRRALVAVE